MDNKADNLLEMLLHREDAKWLHPLLQEIGATVPDNRNMYYPYFNESIPYKDRIAMAEKNFVESAEYMDPSGFSRRKEFTCSPYPVTDENKDVKIRGQYLRPESAKPDEKLPCIFYVQVCAQIFTTLEFAVMMELLCERWHVAMVAVEARIPFRGEGDFFPKTVDDEEGGYVWMTEHADEIGIDPDKVAIWGGSSGGLTCLSLCHRLKRHKYHGIFPRGCIACGPVVDDNFDSFDSRMYYNGAWNGVMSVSTNLNMLHGINPDDLDFPGEAIPQRASVEDCIGLPPTFIITHGLDGNFTACFQYIEKLEKAGVFCEIHHFGGAPHGGAFEIGSELSERNLVYEDEFIDLCFKHDNRRLFIWEMLQDELNGSKE